MVIHNYASTLNSFIRHLFVIFIHIFNSVLNIKINSRINFKTAAVNEFLCLFSTVSGILQVINNLVNYIVCIIRINFFGLLLFRSRLFDLTALIIGRIGKHHFICNSFIIFLLRNKSSFKHFFKNTKLTLSIIFRIEKRVIVCRKLGYTCYTSTFGNIKVFNLFTKICFSRCFYTVTTVRQINRVEIRFHNLIFGIMLFQIESRKNLVKLTNKCYIVFICKILDKLLSDCRTALSAVRRFNHNADGSFPVNTVVLFKSLIFNSNKRL